jgi:hypothetical protein
VYRSGACPAWDDVRRFIRVERETVTKIKTRTETAYYISNCKVNKAQFFAQHIRGHWGIENRLHWVKDVIMNEDGSGIKGKSAAETISLLRNIVINLYRGNGFDSIKYAIEDHANNIHKLFALLLKPIKKRKTK